ncbi:MAG: COX15/CtaA family protein, partial [Longimicrobiales bacterium]
MSITLPAAVGAYAVDDWRLRIPEEKRRPIRAWLWSIAAMTFGVLVVGGITRLTLSGLSIVDWKPLMGVIPPLTEAQWQEAFESYKRFPDYDWRTGMSLAGFKFIFFWEYLHRLLARLIGFVFLVPFA